MSNASKKLEYLSAAELGKAVKTGKVSPTEVITYFVERIKERNPSVNAFTYIKADEAMEQAKLLEERLQNGEDVGPFAGVPFGLKDFLPTKKGWINTHGGVKSLTAIDAYDSVFCEAMEKAGGIALGKTNAPAFGFRGTTDNKMYGPTSTPFNTEYNSGGSSGGSAAAVADGLVPISEGGDAGGSIRVPAAWCNCVGFKASAGRIPNVCRPDAWTATHPFCTPGGLVKTVEDAAILLNYMAYQDKRDPYSVDSSNIDFVKESKKSINGFKIAFTYDFDIFDVDPEVGRIVYNAAMKLKEAGAAVDIVHFKFGRSAVEYGKAWTRAISIDTSIENELRKQEGFDLIGEHGNDLPDEFIYWNDQAYSSTVMDYYQWTLARTEVYDAHREVFDKYDIIISPTTFCLPVKNSDDCNTKGPSQINGHECESLIGFCGTFLENIIGNPACSVPAGLSENGLPVGMQIIGDRFDDGKVLAVARTFEKLQPWKDNFKIAFDRM